MSDIQLSVVIPVTERNRHENMIELYRIYKSNVQSARLNYEFIYVIDGYFPEEMKSLEELKNRGEKIKIIKLGKWFGESTALTAGFEHSRGDLILTLPAYQQLEDHDIIKMIQEIDGNDMVIVRRWPRIDNLFNKIQTKFFHKMVKIMTNTDFHDLGSGVRLIRRKVLKEVQLYGDQHRFLPLLVSRLGFKVVEMDAAQSKKDTFRRIYGIGVYVRRILDLMTVFFLLKFTKKPLRFFGLTGFFIFFIGIFISILLFIQRIFFAIPLADRPMVLVGLLFIVVGIQIVAIGLTGEIIIFTHAKDLKEYNVEKIIN